MKAYSGDTIEVTTNIAYGTINGIVEVESGRILTVRQRGSGDDGIYATERVNGNFIHIWDHQYRIHTKTHSKDEIEMENMKKLFTVIKDDDIKKYLYPDEVKMLEEVLNSIRSGRIKDGKSTDNKYLVVNTDEPYTKDIVEILKRNKHWGVEDATNET